jgi:hypothetical protein
MASGESLGDVSRGRDLIALATAAELVGISQRVLEMAVEYAKDRKQLDRPIGAYQAVSHACADMLKQVEARARSSTTRAGRPTRRRQFSLAASMARLCLRRRLNVSASALRWCGGIGFTWEHDLHWFLKRAKTDGVLYGSARDHRERVAGWRDWARRRRRYGSLEPRRGGGMSRRDRKEQRGYQLVVAGEAWRGRGRRRDPCDRRCHRLGRCSSPWSLLSSASSCSADWWARRGRHGLRPGSRHRIRELLAGRRASSRRRCSAAFAF